MALVIVAITPFGLALALERTTYDEWGLFIWGPVLLLLALPICRWLARRTGEPKLYRFLVGAAFLKIVIGGIARYYVLTEVYSSDGDATRYDTAGGLLAPLFRQGDFTDLGQITGTRFIEVLTGVVQSVIGETVVGSFLVFSFMAFVGLCFFYAAFCEGAPDGNRVFFRRLLFLFPTMWFWPSSIGKEAFLLLCVGAVTFGAALIFNGRLHGLVIGGLGMWGTITVRPHLALALGAALLVAIPPGTASRSQAPFRRRVLALVLPFAVLLALPAIISTTERWFGIEDLNITSAQEFQDQVTARTDQGGSDFDPPEADGPVGVVFSTASLLVRPYVWEADNMQQRLSSLEALLLTAVACIAAWRARWGLVTCLRLRLPRFAIVYVLAFAIGFSAVANFGILVSQRSLAWPFLFIYLAAALPMSRQRAGTEGRTRSRMSLDVSLVINTYNRAHLVAGAITSALEQRTPFREVIVVDDGSTDDTPTVLKEFGDRIVAVRQDNAGLCAARNRGLAEATSDWVGFLDDDDFLLPDVVEHVTQLVTPGVGAVCGGLVYPRPAFGRRHLLAARQARPDVQRTGVELHARLLLRSKRFGCRDRGLSTRTTSAASDRPDLAPLRRSRSRTPLGRCYPGAVHRDGTRRFVDRPLMQPETMLSGTQNMLQQHARRFRQEQGVPRTTSPLWASTT